MGGPIVTINNQRKRSGSRMSNTHQSGGLSRRSIAFLIPSSAVALLWLATRPVPPLVNPMAAVAPFVRPKEKWSPGDFFAFLRALPPAKMLALKKSLDMLPADAGLERLDGPAENARDVQKHALWLSTNIFEYPFLDPGTLDYHALLGWVSGQAGVARATIERAPSFVLERELFRSLFAQIWNEKLSPPQRVELLAKIDPDGHIKGKAAIAALSGAAALAALSSTVAFTGFAFYTTMSITIATVASAVGVTLPFGAYAAASSLIGVLSGPVGWAIMGLSALGGLALAGRANAQKTASLIAQVHALKIEALLAAGSPESAVFSSPR